MQLTVLLIILDEALQTHDPRVALELGTYCGYSTIRIVALEMNKPESKVVSIEMKSHNFGIAKEMIEHAGKILHNFNVTLL